MNADTSLLDIAPRASFATTFLTSAITNYLFAACVVGLTFKQLQLQALGGIGPIEITTAVLCVAIVAASALSHRIPSKGTMILIAAPLLACLLAMGIAAIVGTFPPNGRDTLAYLFTAMVVWSYATLAEPDHKALLEKIALVIGIYLTACALAWLLPWHWVDVVRYPVNGKLQGLSNNPNQIAFLTIVGLSLMYLLDEPQKHSRLALLLSIGAGAAGAFTGSSAITLALGGTIALAIVMRIVSAFSPQRSRAHFPWEYVVPFFFALFATVPIGHAGAPAPQATLEALPSTSTQLADAPSIPAPAVVEPGTSAVTALLEADGGEGSIRLEMWSAAVELIATSPIVGLGPGPHVPWRHPLSGEVTLNEAHNTILDLLLVAGVLGLAAALLPVAIALRVLGAAKSSAWRS